MLDFPCNPESDCVDGVNQKRQDWQASMQLQALRGSASNRLDSCRLV